MLAVNGTAAVSGQDVFDISSREFVNNMCNTAQQPAYKIRAHTEQVTTVVAHADKVLCLGVLAFHRQPGGTPSHQQ